MGTSNCPPETPLGNNALTSHPHNRKKIWAIAAVVLVLLAGGAAAVTYFASRVHRGKLESSAPAQLSPGSLAADPNALTPSLPGSDADQALEGARRLMEKAPTETYDVSAAAKVLGEDIDKNFIFVRDNFAFDPYAGCLRGAQGTLMARAGNDVDRSLLLAALLKVNGHNVRLVRGTLSDADAARLLARAKQPLVPAPVPQLSIEEAAVISGLPAGNLQKLFDQEKEIAQRIGETLEARVRNDTTLIQQKLEAAGLHLTPGADVSPASVRNHVWAQVQVADGWQDFDTSFPEAKAGQRFTEPEAEPVATDSLPGDWYQTLRVRVLSLQPGASNPNELLNQQLRVADLVAQPFGLGFAPVDNEDPLAANTFQPTLVTATNQFTGTNIGLVAAKGDGGGGGMGGMVGALGGEGEDQAGNESEKPLPKILLELTLEGPGAAPERMTRVVADPSKIQDSAKRLPEMRDQLLSLYYFVAAVGPVPPEWVTGQLMTLAKGFTSKDKNDAVVIPMDLLNLAMAATEPDSHGDPSRRYYARPLLLAERFRFRRGRSSGRLVFTKSIDILHNRVEFLGGDALAAVRQGAMETELERIALPGTEVLNTATVFERTHGAVRVLGPDAAAGLGGIDLNAEAKARIGEDLASGYAVIVPASSVEIAGMPAMGWWRVRPQGGETLGRMQSGEGQGMVEKTLNTAKQFIITQIKLSPLTLPGMVVGVQGARCKEAGRTDGWCDPCFLAGASLMGAAMAIYAGYIYKGWLGATLSLGMAGNTLSNNFGACADFVTAGRHGDYITRVNAAADSQ